MRVVWEQGEISVQGVKSALDRGDGTPAYTTVMTVMGRLASKGVLKRRKQGRAYLYSPARTRTKVAGTILKNLVRRLYGRSAVPAIAQLIEMEDSVSEEELRRLEALIRGKRKEIRK